MYKDDTTSYVWERYFTKLKLFCEDNGGPSRVPYGMQHKGLALWLDRQKSNQCMTPKQRQRILELGYSLEQLPKEDWTTRCNSIWNAHFESLKQYKATYGNCNVPSTYTTNLKLANWVASQRRAFGRGDIREDRFQRLLNL